MSGRDHARDFAVSLPQHPQYRRRRLAVVRWHISLCYASIGMGNNVENALIAVISVLTASTSTITVSAVDASTVDAGQSGVPAWVFPLNVAATASPPAYDDRTLPLQKHS